MCCSFEQSPTTETDQAGLLQSTCRTTDLYARMELSADAGDWADRRPDARTHSLLDDPRRGEHHQTGGRPPGSAGSGQTLGKNRDPHLGSWLCRGSLAGSGDLVPGPFYRPLAKELQTDRSGRTAFEDLGMYTRK